MKGILNILKPPQMTSHDVVSVIRKRFNMKKVGHSGTLDPMAVGVLPICIGKATKVIEYMQNDSKTYRAELTLGSITDTQDKWGKVVEERNIQVNEELIVNTFNNFIGEVQQIPPMYSAIKHKGKKLYELAREGISVERKPRIINIYSINIIKIKDNKILFDVTCSKGTYVRTICHDIGLALGCGGHMSFLARLKSGNFSIENTITIEEILNSDIEFITNNYLLGIDYPLYNLIRINIDNSLSKQVLNGNSIELSNVRTNQDLKFGETIAIYIENEFIALGELSGNYIKIKKLFS